MERYFYSKQVIPMVFDDMLMLNETIWPKISHTIHHVGEEDNIEIITHDVLTSDELDEIALIVNNYNEAHPLVVRQGLQENVMATMMEIGKQISAQMAANNLYTGKSDADIATILDEHRMIIDGLWTGSLKYVYLKLCEFKAILEGGGTVNGFTIEEVLEFKRRIGVKIGAEQ